MMRGDFPRVFLLHGEELFLAREFVRALKACLEKQKEVVDYLEWDEDWAQVEIYNALTTFSFGHTKRLVVVNNSSLPGLVPSLKVDNPSLFLVLFSKVRVKASEEIYQFIEERGWVIECAPLRGKKLVKWLQEEARTRRKELPASAGEYLRFLCGDNLAQLRQEIEKASLYLGPEEEVITVAVLKEVGSRTTGRSIFELVDAVAERRGEMVGEILADLFSQGHPPVLIVFLLSRHFLQLLEVACLWKEEVDPAKIPGLIGVHPYSAKKLMKQVRSFQIAELEKILAILLELDRLIKRGQGAPDLLLEAAVSEILFV